MAKVIVLAGGKSSRMGRDKLRLEYRGQTLLRRAFDRFSAEFDTYVSGGSAEEFGAAAIADIFPGCGPISGLHAALLQFETVFLVAADMPFALPDEAKRIIGGLGEFDACAGQVDGRAEPLFAVYSRAVMPEVLRALESGDYSLHRLLERVRTQYVKIDGEMTTNVNYPEDYAKLLES